MAAEDVGSTLSALERKLKDLERELQGAAAHPPPPLPASVPAPPLAADPHGLVPPPAVPGAPPLAPPADHAEPPATTPDSLHAQLDELTRFRAQLERSAHELMSEYERLVARLGGEATPAAALAADAPVAPPQQTQPHAVAPAPLPAMTGPVLGGPPRSGAAPAPLAGTPPDPVAPAPGLVPDAAVAPPMVVPSPGVAPPPGVWPDPTAAPAPAPTSSLAGLPARFGVGALGATPSAPPEPWQPSPSEAYLPPSAGPDLGEVVLEGPVTLDAGPFADIGTLSGFERSVGSLDEVIDVYVSGFEGDRAIVDVTLGRPVALGAALRSVVPLAFTVTQAAPGRLSLLIGQEA